MWKVIFIIFGSSQAHVMNFNEHCTYQFHQCNPYLDSPCCDENNTCQLTRGADQILYECSKKITLGTPCESDSDCSDLESVICSPYEKVCKCSNNYVSINDHKCASLLGSLCMENSDCAVANSICYRNICECQSPYQPLSRDSCWLTTLNKPCLADDDCWATNNTVCGKNGTCVCGGSYQKINNAVCASFLEGYCNDYTDCWPHNSICINNQCECGYEYLPVSRQSCQLSPLGRACFTDTDCNQMSPGSELTEWEYVCKEQNSNKYNFICVPLLGNFCTLQRHCLIDNSHCIFNTCQCKDGFISKFNRKCISALLDVPCRNNNDCEKDRHLICSKNKKCVCELGYVKVDNYTCAPTLGQFCSETDPCRAKNSQCVGSLCRCESNHWPKSDMECVLFYP